MEKPVRLVHNPENPIFADQYNTAKKWLLIYDNVEDPKLLAKYLPPSSGNILITTRFKRIASNAPNNGPFTELTPLLPKESLDLFETSRCHYDQHAELGQEREATSAMLLELGGLPLGIVQIAAYIGYRELSIAEFVMKYKRMTRQIHQNTEGSKTRHSLATVWDMHFENIKDTQASKLLGLLSDLNPDDIDLRLFLPDNDSVQTAYAEFINNDGE